MRYDNLGSLIFFALLLGVAIGACGGSGETEDDGPKVTTTNGPGSGGSGAGSGPGGNGSGAGTAKCSQIGEALQPGTAPQERGDMAFAVDDTCDHVFMVYGDHAVPVQCGPAPSAFLSDVHVYDPNIDSWSTVTVTGTAPIARARSRAIWDAMRRRVILFGGRHRDGTSGPYDFYSDVWAFDPATLEWAELWANGAPGGPSGRMNFTMHADPARDRFLMHGGGVTDFATFTIDNATWAFDLASNTWSQIGTTGALPPARIFHMGAFDHVNGKMVVFGGGGEDAFVATSFFRDTWVLDIASDTWSEVQGTAPEGRIKGEMVFHEAGNRVVLFAGHDDTSLGNNNDVWTLDMGTLAWTQQIVGDTYANPPLGFCDFPSNFATVDPASPERRESHLFDTTVDGTAVMFGGRTDCGLAKDTWELDLESLTWTQINESNLGMTCYRSGSLTCDDADARMCI